jgi:hypothetical protein
LAAVTTRRPRPRGPTMRVEQIMGKFRRLPPEMQKIIEATVDRLLER